jgi:hypothetical protein
MLCEMSFQIVCLTTDGRNGNVRQGIARGDKGFSSIDGSHCIQIPMIVGAIVSKKSSVTLYKLTERSPNSGSFRH